MTVTPKYSLSKSEEMFKPTFTLSNRLLTIGMNYFSFMINLFEILRIYLELIKKQYETLGVFKHLAIIQLSHKIILSKAALAF